MRGGGAPASGALAQNASDATAETIASTSRRRPDASMSSSAVRRTSRVCAAPGRSGPGREVAQRGLDLLATGEELGAALTALGDDFRLGTGDELRVVELLAQPFELLVDLEALLRQAR